MLTSEQLAGIEERVSNLFLESLPQIVNVDVPALITEVKALQAMVFVKQFLALHGGDADGISGSQPHGSDAVGSQPVPDRDVAPSGGGSVGHQPEPPVSAPAGDGPSPADHSGVAASGRPHRKRDTRKGGRDSRRVDARRSKPKVGRKNPR